MKKLVYIVSLLSLSFGLFSCDQDIDYAYKGKDRIHFKHFNIVNKKKTEFNYRLCSMGLLNDTIVNDTAKVVMELLGKLSKNERTYKISVVADSTTAIEGVHYKAFNQYQTFRKNKVIDTLRIMMNRESFNPSYIEREDKILYLKLESTDDFELGLTNGHTMKLVLNNYMTEPDWWKKQQANQYGYFHIEKWKILISFSEKFATYSDLPFGQDSPETREYRKGLEMYLQQKPTYDEYTGERLYMHYKVPQE